MIIIKEKSINNLKEGGGRLSIKFQNNNIGSCFRVYQNHDSKLKSTFYDLIDGDNETKQTKAMAFLLNTYPILVQEIVSIPKINQMIRKTLKNDYINFLHSDYIQVDAEMMAVGTTKIRRDITLTFFKEKIKILIIVIEAKSIKLCNSVDIEKQLKGYLDLSNFPNDKNIQKFGISLTKYNQIFYENSSFVSITWVDIIDILHKLLKNKNFMDSNNLLEDYYKFITGVDKNMKYFEKEVLSVPAGDTFEIIEKYNIHACPNTQSYNYKSSLFITFRKKKGGEMKKIYGIGDVIILNPNDISQLESIKELDLKYIDRLLNYIEERKQGLGFRKAEEYRFYILSESNRITLTHCPKPPSNNPGGWYYKLSEVLSGKEYIEVDSDIN